MQLDREMPVRCIGWFAFASTVVLEKMGMIGVVVDDLLRLSLCS